MTKRSGTISVNTNDIFPIIKKWLYSEHDIFVRELVANSCDAITKRSTLARTQNVEVPTGKIDVIVDEAKKTIQISDNGIGMTEEEVEKYISQLAFSGAKEFVEKLQEEGTDSKNDIIGKFGLGFYSAFMVAEKVEVDSLSFQEGSTPTLWTCEGSTEYNFEKGSRQEPGTTITLHINKESEDFLKTYKLRETLTKHCDFMPIEIYLTDLKAKNEWKKEDNDNKDYASELINETTPIWKKDPKELKDDDYKNFYRKLYPMDGEPLFWIHLKVDHPFTLDGVLFFPKFNPNKPVNERNIKLYCKQVFVSDDVKNIIPEFLQLLKGTIDSSDIPLNVSRSSLQGDPNITRISNYVTKKVAEALKKLFKKDRTRFEEIWPDIHLFAKYGAVSDNKFDDLMRDYILFKNSEEKLVTLKEYTESIPEAYQEKMKGKVLYFEKNKSDHALRKQLLTEGIQVIETEDYIDPHFMQHAEFNKKNDIEIKFCSIDSEIENLLSEENVDENAMKIKDIFIEFLNPDAAKEKKEDDKTPMDFTKPDIEIKNIKNSTYPAYFKVDEQMKRMQKMSMGMGAGLNAFPIKKTLVVNPTNPLIQNTLKIWEKGEKDLASKICHHVKDLATISSEGLEEGQKEEFVSRTQKLIQELSGFAL